MWNPEDLCLCGRTQKSLSPGSSYLHPVIVLDHLPHATKDPVVGNMRLLQVQGRPDGGAREASHRVKILVRSAHTVYDDLEKL